MADLESEMTDQDDTTTPEEYNEYVGMEVLHPRGDGYQRATVCHIKRNVGGYIIGLYNTKLILNTGVYKAVFPGEEGVQLSSKQVAQFILNSFDTEGNGFIIFKQILDQSSDDKAISKEGGFIYRPKRAQEQRNTTK